MKHLYILLLVFTCVTTHAQTSCKNDSLLQICMVTKDSASKNNLIIWQPLSGRPEIQTYLIYRSFSNFMTDSTLIGILPTGQKCIMNDAQFQTDSTNLTFKIAYQDSCGISNTSLPHKIIHLNITQNAFYLTLTFNSPVINQPDYYSSFEVYAGDTINKLKLIQTLPITTFNAYYVFDQGNPQYLGIFKYYQVAAVKAGDACNPSLAKANEGTYARSTSNIEDFVMDTTNTIHTIRKNKNLQLYPNPTTHQLNIALDPSTSSTIVIYNSLNQVVIKQEQTHAAQIESIDISKLVAGYYYIKVISENEISALAFIKK